MNSGKSSNFLASVREHATLITGRGLPVILYCSRCTPLTSIPLSCKADLTVSTSTYVGTFFRNTMLSFVARSEIFAPPNASRVKHCNNVTLSLTLFK